MIDRIKQIIDDQHLTQQNFANITGISPATLSSLFNGRTQPTLKVIEGIKRGFPSINLEWLMYGILPMYKKEVSMESNVAAHQPSADIVHPTQGEASLDFDASHTEDSPSLFERPTVRSVNNTPKNIAQTEVKYINKPQRKITEIRIFYDDQTWETFVPKK